jgi:hypothetical protein
MESCFSFFKVGMDKQSLYSGLNSIVPGTGTTIKLAEELNIRYRLIPNEESVNLTLFRSTDGTRLVFGVTGMDAEIEESWITEQCVTPDPLCLVYVPSSLSNHVIERFQQKMAAYTQEDKSPVGGNLLAFDTLYIAREEILREHPEVYAVDIPYPTPEMDDATAKQFLNSFIDHASAFMHDVHDLLEDTVSIVY